MGTVLYTMLSPFTKSQHSTPRGTSKKRLDQPWSRILRVAAAKCEKSTYQGRKCKEEEVFPVGEESLEDGSVGGCVVSRAR